MKRINVWWCTNDPSNPGWYGEVRNEEGQVIDDTMKIWFPVDVDQFGRQESQKLTDALCEAFPDHEICVSGER